MRILITFFVCLLGLTPFAYADETQDQTKTEAASRTASENVLAPYATLKLAVTGTVDQVIDPLTLRLQDGTVIRLIAIDIPGLSAVPPGPVAAQAFDTVRKAAEGKKYNFYQMHNQPVLKNKFGQILALAVEQKTGLSLQDELLRLGLARVWDGDDTGFDLKWLLEMEDKARSLNSGLWQDNAPTRVFTPADLPVNAVGQIALVTGRVQGIITYQTDLYLDMTDKGLKGFTIKIPGTLRPMLARTGFDPQSLDEQLVRVRGIVEAEQTGLITVHHLWQLEVLPVAFMPKPVETPTVETEKIELP